MGKFLGKQGEVAHWKVSITLAIILDSYSNMIAAPLPSTNEFSSRNKGLGLLLKRRLVMKRFCIFY